MKNRSGTPATKIRRISLVLLWTYARSVWVTEAALRALRSSCSRRDVELSVLRKLCIASHRRISIKLTTRRQPVLA